MPILPIDLQTMFSHMNQVSKDQAVQKEVMPNNQAIQGKEIAEKTVEIDHAVNEAEEVGEGTESVKNKKKEQKKGENSSAGKKKKNSSDKNVKENNNQVVYKDPNLGHHIDLIG